MTMSGTHALGGLAMALVFTWLVKSREYSVPEHLLGIAAFGFVIGQLLPDVDFFVTIPVYPFDPALGEAMHRSFTHSFVTTSLIALLGGLIYWRYHNQELGTLVLAISVGAKMHILFDLPFWFEPLALLWPIFHVSTGTPHWFGIWEGTTPEGTPGEISSLVAQYQPPESLHAILFSWEYGSIAVFLGVLYILSIRLGVEETYTPKSARRFVALVESFAPGLAGRISTLVATDDYRRRLRQYVGFYVGVFALGVALVPFFDFQTHTEIMWGPVWLLLWPLFVWITFKMRPTIETFGREGVAGVKRNS